MIFDLVQTFTGVSASYQVIRQGQIIGEALRKDNVSIVATTELTYGGHTYTISLPDWKKKEKFKWKIEDKKFGVKHIFCDGEMVGEIGDKGRGFGSVMLRDYHRAYIDFNGVEYDRYRVCLGRKGNKFPIYCGEKQVALIEKDIVTKNKNDVYHIFALNGEEIPAIIFAIDVDQTYYRRAGDVSTASVGVEVTYTIPIGRKADSASLYDPEFKNQVEE